MVALVVVVFVVVAAGIRSSSGNGSGSGNGSDGGQGSGSRSSSSRSSSSGSVFSFWRFASSADRTLHDKLRVNMMGGTERGTTRWGARRGGQPAVRHGDGVDLLYGEREGRGKPKNPRAPMRDPQWISPARLLVYCLTYSLFFHNWMFSLRPA